MQAVAEAGKRAREEAVQQAECPVKSSEAGGAGRQAVSGAVRRGKGEVQ